MSWTTMKPQHRRLYPMPRRQLVLARRGFPRAAGSLAFGSWCTKALGPHAGGRMYPAGPQVVVVRMFGISSWNLALAIDRVDLSQTCRGPKAWQNTINVELAATPMRRSRRPSVRHCFRCRRSHGSARHASAGLRLALAPRMRVIGRIKTPWRLYRFVSSCLPR